MLPDIAICYAKTSMDKNIYPSHPALVRTTADLYCSTRVYKGLLLG